MGNPLFNSILLVLGMMGMSTIHAQEIGRRYYFDEHGDSCNAEKAKRYHEYAELPNDPNHIIKWIKSMDGFVSLKQVYLRPEGTRPMVLDGSSEYYWENGQLFSRAQYRYDPNVSNTTFLDGLVECFFENGAQRRRDLYRNGELIQGRCWTKKGADTTHYYFERMAAFPGKNPGAETNASMMAYFSKNVQYPSKAIKKNIQGKVLVSFVIDRDGSVTKVRIVQSVDKLLDKEAVRAIQSMPDWQPAINEGRPVRMSFIVPITFKLQ